MNRCKNCRYFERNSGDYNSDKYGACSCDKFIYGDSDYGDSEDEKEPKLNDKLYYMDYEYYSAFIEVGENFGCIHWRKK